MKTEVEKLECRIKCLETTIEKLCDALTAEASTSINCRNMWERMKRLHSCSEDEPCSPA